MPTSSEYNQFRRYVGDYGLDVIDEVVIDEFLDDATRQSTEDFSNAVGAPAVVTDFDILVQQYHTEVIVLGAINYWWDRAAKLADKHSTNVGQSAQNVSEKWDRAMEMIARLQERYTEIQALGTDITFGNISRFSKTSLTRWGGVREETARDG